MKMRVSELITYMIQLWYLLVFSVNALVYSFRVLCCSFARGEPHNNYSYRSLWYLLKRRKKDRDRKREKRQARRSVDDGEHKVSEIPE